MGKYCILHEKSRSAHENEILYISKRRSGVQVRSTVNNELICLPHSGCDLQIVSMPNNESHKTWMLYPGAEIRYRMKLSFYSSNKDIIKVDRNPKSIFPWLRRHTLPLSALNGFSIRIIKESPIPIERTYKTKKRQNRTIN